MDAAVLFFWIFKDQSRLDFFSLVSRILFTVFFSLIFKVGLDYTGHSQDGGGKLNDIRNVVDSIVESEKDPLLYGRFIVCESARVSFSDFYPV